MRQPAPISPRQSAIARRDPVRQPAPFPGSRPRSGIDRQGKASCRDAVQLTKPDQGGHAHPAVTTTGHDAECLIEHLLRFRQPPRDAIDLAEMAERTDKGRLITALWRASATWASAIARARPSNSRSVTTCGSRMSIAGSHLEGVSAGRMGRGASHRRLGRCPVAARGEPYVTPCTYSIFSARVANSAHAALYIQRGMGRAIGPR